MGEMSFMGENAIGMALMSEFLRDLPSFFHVDSRQAQQGRLNGNISKVLPNPNKVQVFVHSESGERYFSTQGGVVKVENVEELEAFASSLLTKFAFLDVECKRRIKSGNITFTTTGHFAVVINPQHPEIRRQFIDGLNQAKEFLLKGKGFAIEFNFNPVLRRWYERTLETTSQVDNLSCYPPEYTCKYGRLVLTNYSKKVHCFDCTTCSVATAWIMCFPFYVLSCVPYTMYRSCMVSDVEVDMAGEVKYLAATSERSAEIYRDARDALLVATLRRLQSEAGRSGEYTDANGRPVTIDGHSVVTGNDNVIRPPQPSHPYAGPIPPQFQPAAMPPPYTVSAAPVHQQPAPAYPPAFGAAALPAAAAAPPSAPAPVLPSYEDAVNSNANKADTTSDQTNLI